MSGEVDKSRRYDRKSNNPIDDTKISIKSKFLTRIQRVKVGPRTEHKGIIIFPLIGGSESLEFLTLDEALKQGFRIEERMSVNSVKVKNNTDKEVFLMGGEILSGGGQNRVVKDDTLIDKKQEAVIEVMCIEQGRWERSKYRKKFSSTPVVASPSVYAASAHSNQSSTWRKVRELSYQHGIHSKTHDFSEISRKAQEREKIDPKKFSFKPDQIGIISAVKSKSARSIYKADLFNHNRTFKLLFPKLIKSLSVEKDGEPKVKEDKVQSLLRLSYLGSFEEIDTIGLGKGFKFFQGSVWAKGLFHKGKLVHVGIIERETTESFKNL